jgi:hypothetical protein
MNNNIDSTARIDKYSALSKGRKVKNVVATKSTFSPADIIEISPMAHWLRELKEMPDDVVDQKKVEQAKEKLATDSYKNEVVLESIVEEIMQDWGV